MKYPRVANCAVLIALVLAVFSFELPASAQEYPAFGTYVEFTGCSGCAVQGVGLASVPAESQASEVLAALNTTSGLAVAYSLDGSSFSGFQYLGSSQWGGISCIAAELGCGPTVATFNNKPYLAFQNSSNQLVILKGTAGIGANAYTWSLAATINVGGGGMSTAPQAVVFQNKIFIIYGVQNLNGYKGALTESYSSDGVNWTTTAAGLGALTYCAPTQVGLSVLNNTLYMTTQQDNSQRHLYYWSSPNGTSWSGAEDTALYTDSGISMVTYKDNLVFATKQDNSQDHLFIFSSPNGSTWYAEQYSPVMQNNTSPALALFNNGVTVAYVNSSTETFYAAFASQ